MNALTRRSLVQGMLSAGIVAALPLGCRRGASLPAPWTQLHPDPFAAAHAGSTWLAAQSSPPTAEALLARLCEPHAPDALAAQGLSAIRTHVLDRHRADFAAGRTVRVERWLLSQTEVDLYALLAHSEPSA